MRNNNQMNIDDIEKELESIEEALTPKDVPGRKKMVDSLWSLLASYDLKPQEKDLELAEQFINNLLKYRKLVENVVSRHNLEQLMNNEQ